MLLRDARLPRAQPRSLGSVPNLERQRASLHYPPPCPQPSWKVTVKAPPFLGDPPCPSSICPYSSSSHPAQKTPLAWQGCPGVPTFRSTQTFKSPCQVLPDVVNLQMLQKLVDVAGALGQVDKGRCRPTVTTTKASHADSLLSLGFLVY